MVGDWQGRGGRGGGGSRRGRKRSGEENFSFKQSHGFQQGQMSESFVVPWGGD